MKNFKKFISVLSAAALSCTMIACGGKTDTSHTHTYSDGYAYNDTYHYHETTCGHDVAPENSDGYAKHSLANGECSVCDYVQPLTLDEFATDYNKAATDFIKNKIRPSVVGNNQVKAEQWYIEGNSNNELSEINIVWTYTVNETDRKTQWANVTLADPIPFRNIANNKYSLNSSELDIDRTDIFEFDAKINYNKQNIAAALYQKAELTADVKLYAEIDSGDGSYRSFKLLGQADNKIIVKRINVLKSDGSDDTLLNNINRPFTTMSTVNEYEVNGTNIYESAYALENLGAGEGPDPIEPDEPDPEEPEQPEQPVTNSEIIAALEEYCLDGILRRIYLGIIDVTIPADELKTKISNKSWYATKDSNENILGIELSFNFNNSNGASFRIGKLVFSSPISVKELINGNFTTERKQFSSVYSFSYDLSIQETRSALKNAICDKIFGENEGTTRFIVDIGYITDSTLKSDTRAFQLVEITNDGIKESHINIKRSSNDNEYINKLSDSSNYRAYGEKSYAISGVKVENNDSPFAAD